MPQPQISPPAQGAAPPPPGADERRLEQALAQRPDDAALHLHLARVRLATNRLDPALAAATRAAQLAPADAAAQLVLAECCRRLGRGDDALRALRAATALAPDRVEGWAGMGDLLLLAGKVAEAVEAYRRAAALSPRDPRPARALGAALARLGQHEESVAAFRAAAAADPTLVETLNSIGVSLDALGRRDEAVCALKSAALLAPESASVQDNLGNALLSTGQSREAEACHRRALALGSTSANSWSNLGNALHRQGRLEESEAAYRRAIQLAPSNAKFRTNLALTLLLEGKFAEGWHEYEWRWRDHPGVPAYLRDKPWRGEDMPDGTLLLQAEQGYGDTIQFIRYVPLLRRKVGRLVLACQPELLRLMGTVAGLDAVVPETRPPAEFDAAITLMSVAGIFGTDLGNIPGGVPYLSPPPGAGVRLPPGKGLKVGIAWAGRPTHGDDWNRSIPARLLEPLLAVPGVTFYSLQRGAVAERLGRPAGRRLIEVADSCADFADTAAVVDALDLVISVDTAVVHMAGAMGKPVWLLLPPVPDFRWLMSGDTTPWYPSLRLFRKAFDGSWEPVLARLAGLLREKAEAHAQA
ncbi:MAG: tetratricopeptide repeat protein [Actinomycetota bacterium]